MVNPAGAVRSGVARLGRVEAIPVGQGLCFRAGGEEIAVFRQRDGRLFAVQNRCPHRQGPLSEGILGDGHVICPLHGHKFDLAGGTGPVPQECLKTYPVRDVEGELRVILEPRPAP